MTRIIACSFALLASTTVLISPSCGASPASITVAYRDLNPTTPEGARTLLGRIEKAAEKVCGGDPWKQHYTADTNVEVREFKKCMAVSVAQALASLNAPLVRQAYDEQLRKRTPMVMR